MMRGAQQGVLIFPHNLPVIFYLNDTSYSTHYEYKKLHVFSHELDK